MSNTIIQLKNISKVFQTNEMETYALAGIDLSIDKGDYVSISGPSGCGKSTLLSILGLLDMPTSGNYLLEEREVAKLSLNEAAEVRNSKIGFVFQSFNLIDELSVFENIALPLQYSKKGYSDKEIKERVNYCLEKVQMTHRINHKPNQLSGGQQQRISIARSLVANPTILLVDEPTGNLDSKNGDAVMDMLSDLNSQGTTICMVTHDPRYANQAIRQLHLLDGEILERDENTRVPPNVETNTQALTDVRAV